MFRCKECGSEFDIKPDYCDCGNDTFEEIVEKAEPVIEEKSIKNENMWVEENGFGYPIKEETYNEFAKKNDKNKQKSEPVIKFEKPNLPQIKIEPLSLTIFLICILLSVFVIFFVGNPKEDMITDKSTETSQTTGQNIPSIDKIWDNTLPVRKVEETPVVQEPVIQQPIQTPQPVEVKKNENKVVQQIQQKPAVNTQKQTKSAQTQTTSKQTQTQTQTKPKQQATTPAKTTPSAQTPVQTPTQVKTIQPQQAKTVNPQEMLNYKIALRNKLASKIDFTSILGDGTCVVSFKVSPSGTLTNRTFVKQSENGILNDIVYNAIMSTPTFNSPPSSYNNETLKFTVKMYDGRYEVSLN